MPESFKVLVKELQSLGLDIRVLNKDMQEIDLKQTFEDDDDLIVAPIDDEAFSSVADENELNGYSLEEPELPDDDLLDDDDADDEFLGDDDSDEL